MQEMDTDQDSEDEDITSEKSQNVRYRARVAYDGTKYSGWQVQSVPNNPNHRTVQGELQKVLSRRFQKPVSIVGAGRTDSGVHARGQAIQFDLPTHLDENNVKALEYSLNQMLEKDIRVWDVNVAPLEERDEGNYRWSAIQSANQKLYSYRFCINHAMSPTMRYTRVHIDVPLDIDRMAGILKHFEGTHDFRAFSGAIEANEKKRGTNISTIKTVYKVDLVQEGYGLYRIDFYLKGALYKMVRNMVGSSLEVCKGKMEEQRLIDLLHQKSSCADNSATTAVVFSRKDNKTKPAPPEGLTLEWVYYDNF